MAAVAQHPQPKAMSADELARYLAWEIVKSVSNNKLAALQADNNTQPEVRILVTHKNDSSSSSRTKRRKSGEAVDALEHHYAGDMDDAFNELARLKPDEFLRTAARRGITVTERMDTDTTLALINEGNFTTSQTRIIRKYLNQVLGFGLLETEKLVRDHQKRRRLDDEVLQ